MWITLFKKLLHSKRVKEIQTGNRKKRKEHNHLPSSINTIIMWTLLMYFIEFHHFHGLLIYSF